MPRDRARRLARAGALLAFLLALPAAGAGRYRPAHVARVPQPAAGARDHRRQRYTGPGAGARGARLRGAGPSRHGAGACGGRRLLADRARAARARTIDPFKRVRWSSPRALADTERGLPAGFRLALVDRLADVDDGPAYWSWRARASEALRPCTQASATFDPRTQASATSDPRTQASATHSISMSNSMGQDAMATKVRAGGS